MRNITKQLIARAGFRVERISVLERYLSQGYDPTCPLDVKSADYLRRDNPRLRQLQADYQRYESPLALHTQWSAELASDDLDLQFFRGDNAYLWQYTRSAELHRLRSFIFARYVQSADELRVLSTVREDGAFGCFSHDFPGLGRVSRDLLDSVNEINFLARHWPGFARPGSTIADIGAGYGRLAHRLGEVLPSNRYICLDAVPRSTFLSEYYLHYRGIAAAEVVPLYFANEVPAPIDLAVSVHSLSEMSRRSVQAWLQWCADRAIPHLFLVPNEGERLLSRETDGSRTDCVELLADSGYSLTVSEPTIRDVSTRAVLGINDYHLLFERSQ